MKKIIALVLTALLALSHHPLVDSVHVAEQLLDDFADAFDGLEYLKDAHA